MPRGGKRIGSGAKLRAGSLGKNRSVKFTDEEWNQVKRKAAELGRTVSDYIRELVLK